ncbi:MAG: ATP-dependent helicase DeaD [Fusobacteriaceae bacterium]|jgi:ATP-dependent RNA helicase DeaD|nr:ATP-dependent helicase DeaD [Fusobacteriaceae bacterium]
MNFNEFNIKEEIKKAISELGYIEPTEIQEKAIPLLLEGSDMIGQSQTGTGKTAAFSIPALNKVDVSIKSPQIIVVCPTRELAVQVSNEFEKLSKYMKELNVLSIYGGTSIERQIKALKRGVQIIVGTPGRIMDHLRRRTLKVDNINTVILDEADEMLKMGFREDIETILEDVNEDRQTVLFSATMPQVIMNIAKKYQKNPKLVKITQKTVTSDTIKQHYYLINERDKNEAVNRLIHYYNPEKSIIFCNTKSKVDDITEQLQKLGLQCEKIHGDLKQEARMRVLQRFNEGDLQVIIATDVAARGLDIQNVELVINYDLPDKEEYYVHRIGRSGRAGKEGHSITLTTPREKRKLVNIEKYINKEITKKLIPSKEDLKLKQMENFLFTIEENIEKSDDLDVYFEILHNLFDRGYEINEIAAVLLKMNTEFYEDEKSKDDINYKEIRKNKESNRGRDNKDTTRMYINVGRKDKITKKDVLGAILNECNLKSQDVGNIDILDKFSFVEIRKSKADKVLKILNDNKQIKGKKISIEKAKKR